MRTQRNRFRVSTVGLKVNVPAYHYNPLARLEKPITFDHNYSHPLAPLRFNKFHHVLQKISLHQKELVYDPSTHMRSTQPRFSGEFECGNLGQVFKTGPFNYEIHILPDPTRNYSALWYFFKCENMQPGEYTFTIVGFFRDAHLHKIGVQPTALSLNKLSQGIGWHRLGDNMNFWCWKRPPSPEYALSFSFIVRENDTMYFSYLYPYTYSEMKRHISSLRLPISYSILCKTLGGVEFPAIFWDADIGRCVPVKNLFTTKPQYSYQTKKPLIVFAARHHPGESNSSYAMEGFLNKLFNPNSPDSIRLLNNFTFLIFPMMNPDGVICGYYRPTLSGYDMNRAWINPSRRDNPVEYAVVSLIDKLVVNRPLLFFLDYHGHTAQCNAFTYGIWDEYCALNEYEGIFPRLMARITSLFDENSCISYQPESYPSTMRVALHHRYQIPFAYTLEMSFGGINIGSKSFSQMTPQSYREIGESTIPALAEMLIDHVPTERYVANYSPPFRRSSRYQLYY